MKHLLLILLSMLIAFFTRADYRVNANVIGNLEPIRGIYVTATHTLSPYFDELLKLVNKTDLNAMVIDIKDDYGNLTFKPTDKSPYASIAHPYIQDGTILMQTLKQNNIYSIARIVVFKDTVLAKARPELSFQKGSRLWKNQRGDSFTNPFLKEVWDHNIGMAIEAAKLGFDEIQFDYVRFPERFETFQDKLQYANGGFKNARTDGGKSRVVAVTGFVKYAVERLKPYDVNVSVDVFGNATVIPEARGIGQNFSQIADSVDVISAMIYPSHWNGIFKIQKPDLEPYKLVKEYALFEKSRLQKLSTPPITRPWLQDFTATWLGKGNFRHYGKQQIEDQIRALHEAGINEYLLWNARNKYTPNVDYTPY